MEGTADVSSSASGPSSVETFQARCLAAGFDVVHPFGVDAYNDAASAEHRLPRVSGSGGEGFLVGNTRGLWPAFLEALRAEPARLEREHPLDAYTEERLAHAAAAFDAEHIILWAHEPPPSAVPVQRIAQATGLAWLSPSHLSIHPEFGPWLAFRAVVLVAGSVPADTSPSLPCPDPCNRCAKPCVPALADALAASATLGHDAVAEHFALFRRVRDVCPEGLAHRYGEVQLRYHYTKDRTLLRGSGDGP